MASVDFEVTETENPKLDEIRTAKETLEKFIAEVTPRFERLDGDKSVTILSGNPDKIPNVHIPIKQLQQLWSRIAFVVTDKVYPAGYGGAFDLASMTSHIRYDTVNGWNAHPGGLGLIVLHELLHATAQGAEVWKNQWANYLADCRKRGVNDDEGKHYWTSPFFSEVEEFCYVGSRELNAALGLPPYAGKPFDHGYEYGVLD